ncbi:MAG: hypothetical protein KJO47_00705, partial [Gammaproteobacteria bacterium]|nr:hypothetical protein [Gammaproteobacteria bacterium]
MSTVIPNDKTQLEELSSTHPAPKKILKSTYENVLAALQKNKRVILITGDTKKGKTALIHTISKNISTTHRIITLSGKDLPTLNKSKNNSNTELSNMKDFILKSTDLGDKLVVTLDDAYCLPISFLGELIKYAQLSTSNGYSLQLILSGPLNFKDQLLAIEQLDNEDLIHCPMDSPSEQEIHSYAKNKSYMISSNIKRLDFKPESLRALADFIQSDQQLLDVVLEWCAALAKKDQLTSITSHTVNRAAGFAQQYSKDKNLHLANSYPPSHEVYKYINDFQSAKNSTGRSTKRITKKSVKILNKNKVNKPFIKTSKTSATQETKIPTITSKVELSKEAIHERPIDEKILQNLYDIKDDKKPIKAGPIDEDTLQSLHEIEEEIMPPQWTPSSRRKTANKKSFFAMVGLLSLLLLGFITFIAFRIGSDPNVSESTKQQAVLDETQEAITEDPKLIPETASTEDTVSIDLVNQEVEKNETPEVAPKPLTGPQTNIVASDTKKAVKIDTQIQNPVPIIAEKNISIDEQTGIITNQKSKEQNKILDEELAQNEQDYEKQLKAQKTENIKSQSSPAEKNSSVATDAEINKLLVLAEYQFEKKQLSTPSGDNALETYQKILAKYPSNKAAVNGVKKVHDKYINWATYYLKHNDTKRAKDFYNKALRIDPNNSVAIANLQNIAQQQAVENTKTTSTPNLVELQSATPSKVIQNLLVIADKKMQQIESEASTNNRNYKIYQEAQTTYQDVLRSQPQNQQAIQGLSSLTKYYADWA